MTRSLQDLISQLILEEKAALCTGATPWLTAAVDRLGIDKITMTDGPHGIRRSVDITTMISGSHPATAFPVAALLAATWDKDLLYELGQALADECLALDVDVLLGPGINIKRSPLCGRNFEYFSEDPVVAGELSASLINGVQSKGVGTSLKHFAVNNQETLRFTVSSVIDERILHEIYLRGFEIAVTKAQPWTIMAAYNKVNGVFCSQHDYLLTDVLRDQWGFEGVIVSDWGAVRDRVAALQAGLDLQMPGPSPFSVKAVVDAVNSGELDESVLDHSVAHLLKLVEKAKQTSKPAGQIDIEGHHALAKRIASEGIVLLKNEGNLLPLKGHETLAVIGQAAMNPGYQGGGSSHINPTRVDNPLELLRGEAEVQYAAGDANTLEVQQVLIDEAVRIAQSGDVALLFIALPARIESEGYDRHDLNLTPQQIALIQAVAAVQPRTVVILNNGSAIDMRAWIDQIPAVIEAWLPGQAGAGAVLDVLYGRVNPSGKLTETFPLRLEDTPAYLNFPGENGEVYYGEGIFVGYRSYEARDLEVLFPFGYGLSYTQFQYSNLRVSKTSFNLGEPLEITLDVTNTGQMAGKEIVQLYVRDVESRLIRPPKELKAFAKVMLQPGETKQVRLTVDDRAFSYYDPAYHRWLAEAGEFEILVGSSSADIHLRQTVALTKGTVLPSRLNLESTLGDWLADERGAAMVEPLVQIMMGAAHQDSADIGMDMGAFFKDLPLTSIMMFQPNGDTAPEQIVGDMLKQVYA